MHSRLKRHVKVEGHESEFPAECDGKPSVRPEDSHRLHAEAWERDAADSSRSERRESWFRTDTADYWRHLRMYEAAKAFLHNPHSRWLTVGDGRFGLDAIRLRRLGFSSVLPSDIGGALLEESRQRKLIDTYAIENAESLSFSDESFDLVFCKESYHHFPRPALALYEMLRVAREAVVLIEPRDSLIDHGPTRAIGPSGILAALKTWFRDRRGIPHPALSRDRLYMVANDAGYEEAGNYLYTISSREMQKVALGLNLPVLALKGLNDAYFDGLEAIPASETSTLFKSMQRSIEEADQRNAGGRSATSMLMVILFKTSPTTETLRFLAEYDWLVIDLPRNPAY